MKSDLAKTLAGFETRMADREAASSRQQTANHRWYIFVIVVTALLMPMNGAAAAGMTPQEY